MHSPSYRVDSRFEVRNKKEDSKNADFPSLDSLDEDKYPVTKSKSSDPAFAKSGKASRFEDLVGDRSADPPSFPEKKPLKQSLIPKN